MRTKHFKRTISFLTAVLLLSISVSDVYAASENAMVFVRFVTSWNSNRQTGGTFQIQNADEFPLDDGMESANYVMLSDDTDAEFDGVAAWDVYYSENAETINAFPDVEAKGSDAFLGWMDTDGNFVDEETVIEDGAVYTAVYEIAHTAFQKKEVDPVDDMSSGEEETVPETVIRITYAVDGNKGSFGNLSHMDIPAVNSCVLSHDSQNLTVSYNTDGELSVLPTVVPVKGYSFAGWKDREGNRIDEKTGLSDNSVYEAVFENPETGTDPVTGNNTSDDMSGANTGSNTDGNKGSYTDNNTNKNNTENTGTYTDSNKSNNRNNNTGNNTGSKSHTDTGNYINSNTDKQTSSHTGKYTGRNEVKNAGSNTGINSSSGKNGLSETSGTAPVRSNSWSGNYIKSDGTMDMYTATRETGWLTQAEHVTAEDGTPLYQDSDGNIVSYPTGYDEEQDVYRYLLHVRNINNVVQDFGCTGDQTLSEIADLMGYDVSIFAVEQAEIEEHAVDGTMDLASVVKLFENGDIRILGYEDNNVLFGCATVKQTAYEYEYDVLLEKEADTELRTADQVAADIQKALDEMAAEQKEAEQQMTVSSIGLPVYLGLGISTVALILGYLIYVWKKGRDDGHET